MPKDPMSTDRRNKPTRRKHQGGGSERENEAATEREFMPDRRRVPDPRVTALRVLSAFLKAAAKPPDGKTPMPVQIPAPPRHPAGGAGFPRRGPASPTMVASAPPQVPFPTPAPAAAGFARPTAMEAIGRFLEMARAGGLVAHRRRRG